MEKKKVFVPCYGGCEFGSLGEAVNYVQKMPGGLDVYICDIVLYNIRFRDRLREKGIDGVIRMLIKEAPAVAHDIKALDGLKRRWRERMKEHIADYDIQCLPKNSRFCIEGCWFDGLEDLDSQVEMSGNPRHQFDRWYTRDGYKPNSSGLHVGRIWVSYPTFDSFDACDGRSYDNYIFPTQPLKENVMDLYCEKVNSNFNACMVHESIPEELLPILYYNGDSEYVLLATAKVKKFKKNNKNSIWERIMHLLSC